MLDNSSSELLGCIFNDVKTGVFSGKKVWGGYGGYGGYKKYGYAKYGYGKTEKTHRKQEGSEIEV